MSRRDLLFNRYKLLALNMFRWENLPPTIESRHIEKALFECGQAIFFEHEDFGLICLPCNGTNAFNIYGEPLYCIATGHGFTRTIKVKDGVLAYNNDLAIPTLRYIDVYSRRMAEVEFSIDLNIRQQRIPWIAETTQDNKFSMERVFKKIIDEGKPVVYVNKNLGLNNTNVITLNTPYVVDKLNSYKYDLEREILTFLGLNNTMEKRERMVVDEVNVNNDFVDRNVEIMYKNRLKVCEQLKERFGLDVRVIKNNDTYNEIENEDNLEGDDD